MRQQPSRPLSLVCPVSRWRQRITLIYHPFWGICGRLLSSTGCTSILRYFWLFSLPFLWWWKFIACFFSKSPSSPLTSPSQYPSAKPTNSSHSRSLGGEKKRELGKERKRSRRGEKEKEGERKDNKDELHSLSLYKWVLILRKMRRFWY